MSAPDISGSGVDWDDADNRQVLEYHLLQFRAREEAKRLFAAERTDVEHDGHALLYTDVAAMFDGTVPEAPRPEILRRTDGVPLFYRGEVNVLFGDPEHGKTWVGMAACAEVLCAGGRVLIADLDYNGATAIVDRLVMLGAPKRALRDQELFRHCRPGAVGALLQVVADCAAWKPDVVMVDSAGELLPMFGANSDSADDFTRVHRRVLQPLADTGAAVLLVDHLAKGRESRDLGPGGTIAKRRTVGGLLLRVVRERPFSRSGGGSARLLINKDRHGGVREHCATPPAGQSKAEQEIGVFALNPTDRGPGWQVSPPKSASDEQREFRPTVLMERASKAIEEQPGYFTKDKLATQVTGNKEKLRSAVVILEREDYVTKSEERYPHYTSVKPYRQADDPQSEEYMPLGNPLLLQRDSAIDNASDDG